MLKSSNTSADTIGQTTIGEKNSGEVWDELWHVTFEVRNISERGQNAPILFISDNPDDNRLQLIVRSSAAITIGHQPAYSLSEMIGFSFQNNALKHFKVSCPSGWDKQFQEGSQSLIETWRIYAASGSQEVAPEQPLVIDIENIVLDNDTRQGMHYFKILFAVRLTRFVHYYPLLVSGADQGTQEMAAVHAGPRAFTNWNMEQDGEEFNHPWKSSDSVFVERSASGVKSRLGFQVFHHQAKKIPKLNDSRLEVGLPTGWGIGALNATERLWESVPDPAPLSEVELEFLGSSAKTAWKITKSQTNSQSFWILTPEGPNFFEQDEVVSFAFRGIQPYPGIGKSAIYIAHLDFPEYANGIFPMEVRKVQAHPIIFEAYATHWGNEGLMASWRTFGGSTKLNLRNFDGPGDVQSFDVPHSASDYTWRPPAPHRFVTISVDSEDETSGEYILWG